MPKDKKAVNPFELLQSISSKGGAGFGAKARRISLNLSTAVPIGVDGIKSVNKPSVYKPSSGAPIEAVTDAMPEESSFITKPGPNFNVATLETEVEPEAAVIDPPPALDAIVIVSEPAVVVNVIFEPAAKVKVSVSESATTLSTSMAELALDVASFNNKADADVIRDFQSALVGNHETVLKYGIKINEAALKQEAYNLGLYSGQGALAESAKLQARVNLIMQGTTDAQGDLIRTQADYANQAKTLQANVYQVYKDFGDLLIRYIILNKY